MGWEVGTYPNVYVPFVVSELFIENNIYFQGKILLIFSKEWIVVPTVFKSCIYNFKREGKGLH